MLTLLTVAVVAPVGLISAARSRFGSANPLAGADPPWRWGSGDVGDALTGPIADDTVVDGIVRLGLCVVWVAMAVVVATTVVEVVHAVRHHGLGLPDIRGVGWAQRVARFIAIGLVAILPMITPSTSLASTLDARPAATAPGDSTFDSTIASPTTTPVPTPVPEPVPERIHVVVAGESIYSIALELAGGDQSHVLEVADALIDANIGTVMPGGQRFTNPAYVEVDWPLQIPAGVAGEAASVEGPASSAVFDAGDDVEASYTVEVGDTLWDIADEQLGDPEAWPEIWERNAGDDMGGGRTFDDPGLILPGWELELADAVAEETPVTDITDRPDWPAPTPTDTPIEPAPSTVERPNPPSKRPNPPSSRPARPTTPTRTDRCHSPRGPRRVGRSSDHRRRRRRLGLDQHHRRPPPDVAGDGAPARPAGARTGRSVADPTGTCSPGGGGAAGAGRCSTTSAPPRGRCRAIGFRRPAMPPPAPSGVCAPSTPANGYCVSTSRVAPQPGR